MHDADDVPRGRVRSRRDALALLCGAAMVPLAGGARAATACVATPAQTEGPFFLDARLERSDIRSDTAGGAPRAGTPLTLELSIRGVSAAGCTPLAGAIVDLWHCDAEGVYSGTRDGARFLRGYQRTDATGRVRFVTIYPGWYGGRAVHIHFKVRDGRRDFTSQFYFDDAFTQRVFAQAPYAARGRPDTVNARDFVFRQGGRELMLAPVARDGGLAATFDIALADG